MIYLGVDPGLTGGLALVNGAGLLSVKRMAELVIDGRHPKLSGALLAAWLTGQWSALQTLEPTGVAAFIERAQAFPQEGVSSAFNYGTTWGIVIGVVEAMGLPLAFVPPATWKKAMGLAGLPKDAARQMAVQTWPQRASWFDRKYDCGLADAALIAEWARTRAGMAREGP